MRRFLILSTDISIVLCADGVFPVQVPPNVSAHHADAVDKAVAALRYGSVNINVVTMLGFCVPKLTWGAYPGNKPQACPCCALSQFMNLPLVGSSLLPFLALPCCGAGRLISEVSCHGNVRPCSCLPEEPLWCSVRISGMK